MSQQRSNSPPEATALAFGQPFVFEKQTVLKHLSDSLETMLSFLAFVPERWTHDAPDGWPEGSWGAAMNLAHLIIYDEKIAGSVLRSMAAGGDGSNAVRTTNENWFLNDAVAIAPSPLDELAGRLRAARDAQIEIVASMPEDLLNRPLTRGFAHSRGEPLPASWVATKSFQHTWEHGNEILRIALFAPR